jgi:hypothetical protein
VSIKDGWVGPREQVLNVLTTYQRYEPDKPSSLVLIDAWLSPLLWLRVGEKLDGDPQISQPVCWDVVGNSFFSGVVTLSNSIIGKRKVAMCRPREIRMVWVKVHLGP